MATFTEAQITDLAEILSTNSSDLSYHLDAYEGVITDSDKTRVLELVTEWQALSTSDLVTTIEPNVRNFGVRMGAGATASNLVKRIGALLQFEPVSSNRLVRA